MKIYREETEQGLRFNYPKIFVSGSVILMVILNKYNATDLSLWIVLLPLWLPLASHLIVPVLDYILREGE
jgi:hypothetical protein